MDAALKARGIRSASARRKKILEREDSVRKEEEAREKRRRKIIFDYDSDEEQDSDSDDGGDENTYSPIEDKVASESGKQPDDPYFDEKSRQLSEPSPREQLRRLSAQLPPLKLNTRGMTVVDVQSPSNLASQPSSPPPKQDTPTVRVLEEELFNCLYTNHTTPRDDESEVDFDPNDQYSPIEIATPIVFKLPRRRATLVSIETPSANSPKEPTTEPPPPPKPKRSTPRRPPSMISVKSGFAACEATPFEPPPLPTPPYNVNGFDFNLPSTESSNSPTTHHADMTPTTSRPASTAAAISTTIKRTSSLLSRSRSWRENHKNRQAKREANEPHSRPQTSTATKSATPATSTSTSVTSSPSLDDYEFEIPPGFPLPPTNIPTPLTFLTEDPNHHLSFSLNSTSSNNVASPLRSAPLRSLPTSTPSYKLIPTLTAPASSEVQALPPTPSDVDTSSSRTASPSPYPTSSSSTNSSGFSGLLTRKKSLNSLRTRSGSVGKALASRGAKLGRQVSETVWKGGAPPLPPPVPQVVGRE
jgi:hypothetical protein